MWVQREQEPRSRCRVAVKRVDEQRSSYDFVEGFSSTNRGLKRPVTASLFPPEALTSTPTPDFHGLFEVQAEWLGKASSIHDERQLFRGALGHTFDSTGCSVLHLQLSRLYQGLPYQSTLSRE